MTRVSKDVWDIHVISNQQSQHLQSSLVSHAVKVSEMAQYKKKDQIAKFVKIYYQIFQNSKSPNSKYVQNV